MKKRWTQSIVWATLLSMLVSLTACNSGKDPSSSTSSPGGTGSQDSSTVSSGTTSGEGEDIMQYIRDEKPMDISEYKKSIGLL